MDEIAKFKSLSRKIARDTAKLAASAQPYRCDDAKKLYRACDRIDGLVRFACCDCLLAAEILFAHTEALRAAVTAASEQASQNYREALQAESMALQAAHRERMANMGGYEKELMLMRGR